MQATFKKIIREKIVIKKLSQPILQQIGSIIQQINSTQYQ
ncbi:unnamed protein product [Paramecium octaurelia]|uniref:Uncharacterized protein n=1 Tax=Paramecium octaurelia TaxID=43137 RepID=A0A8S1RXU9_PAROT|nr:unnamed protein product [Paramecium octaurelia]